jgi:hypothetical protein
MSDSTRSVPPGSVLTRSGASLYTTLTRTGRISARRLRKRTDLLRYSGGSRNPETTNTPHTCGVRSGLVGSVGEEFRSRSGIALVDEHLRPSRKHERKGAASIIGSDRCVDPCRSEQTLNDLRLVPRPKGAYRDLPAHSEADDGDRTRDPQLGKPSVFCSTAALSRPARQPARQSPLRERRFSALVTGTRFEHSPNSIPVLDVRIVWAAVVHPDARTGRCYEWAWTR